MKWAGFLKWTGEIFNPSEIEKMLQCASITEKIKTNKKITYYNTPCAFDIETTSYSKRLENNDAEKIAFMYEWTLGLNGYVMIGRTWQEFICVVEKITELLQLSVENRLIVYVHNLSFEFQFFRKLLTWEKIFAIDERKPVYALTVGGIEFRCSYILSGYGLAKLGDQLQRYHVQKMTGDLDYSLIRHSLTPLTEKEIGYCVNDVAVVMCYIQETIENDGDITRIPLTKTGYVRNYCRNACLYDHTKNNKKYHSYRNLMQELTLTPDEYAQLKRAFQGGFTHANAQYSGKILHNVASYDFTSSYPCVMLAEKYPISRGKIIELNTAAEFEKYLNLYCCLFDVEFFNIRATVNYEHYLSYSRCAQVINPLIDNGRVVEADHLITTITEQDYFIISKMYAWDKIRIYNFRVYERDYLPTDFVKSIIELYENKTKLKNVDGKEIEYLKSKEMINSCYGMTVTDICRDEITYNNEWGKTRPETVKTLQHYNKSQRRFLFYPWGVWVTAYARANLFTGIMEFKNDYIYADTDSVKVLNYEKHSDYIQTYNTWITSKLTLAGKHHGIAPEKFAPQTVDGVQKPLGVWDFEGVYSRFKTLGAKRYMTEKNGKISLTVSGVNKKIAVPYLMEKYGDNIFIKFSDGLHIPENATGKNTHTYIDELQRGTITDYLGNTGEYYSPSGVHLMGADYTLSLSSEYLNYLAGIRPAEY